MGAGNDNPLSAVVDVNVVLPYELEQVATLRAVAERVSNAPTGSDTYELVVARAKLWQSGRTLRVRFLGGSQLACDRALIAAKEWTHYANLVLLRSDDLDAELRVGFDRTQGCWSYIGTDSLSISPQKATINLSILGESTPPPDWRKYVLHEFGHALGCVHEHQSPVTGIKWNRPVVYAYYFQHFGWNKGQVDYNVFHAMDSASTNHTDQFDPDSIMVYPIPKEHTLDGYSVEWRSDLSSRDKEFIASVYPKD